jgi:hypothetical protein
VDVSNAVLLYKSYCEEALGTPKVASTDSSSGQPTNGAVATSTIDNGGLTATVVAITTETSNSGALSASRNKKPPASEWAFPLTIAAVLFLLHLGITQ